MNGHDELIELLGVYALDAVSPDERRAIEAHLEVCASCRAEVADHLEVAAGLSALSIASPPDDLFARILRGLDDTTDAATPTPGPVPRLHMLTAADPAVGASVPVPPAGTDATAATATTATAATAATAADASPPPASIDVARQARADRGRGGTMKVGAIIAAAAVVIAVLGLGLIQVTRHSRELDQQLAQPGIELAADQARADPASRQLPLKAADGTTGAVAVITPTGSGYLIPEQLDPLPADRTYQLWVIGDAGPISLGVLGNEPGVTGFHVQGPVGTVAITTEANGGAPAPTGSPLLATT